MRRRAGSPRTRWLHALAVAFILAAPAAAKDSVPPPSKPGIDAPELAALGRYSVGYKSVTFVHRDQPNLLATDVAGGTVPLYDRKLSVDLWYPAKGRSSAKPVVYRGTLYGEPPQSPVAFTQRGIATANAKPDVDQHPLVIVSHGYSNSPPVMTWLTENLASKGYVVAAIRHEDPNPYIASANIRAAPNFYRPEDIAFVAAQLRATLRPQIDGDRVALIGYSQGGYGVLTSGGASLDPGHANMDLVAGGWLKTIARGRSRAQSIIVPNVKAIIALAPGGGGTRNAWGDAGLAGIKAPLLLIAGDHDPVVGYELAAKSFFAAAVSSDRYLLTYKQAGHSIALNPAPTEMRSSVWDIDWFEDPIWRQDRINAINLHFITAFLDLHLRGEVDKAAFLNVPAENSDEGEWNAPAGTAWGAVSPGGAGVTLWKGFQRRHAKGLKLEHREARK